VTLKHGADTQQVIAKDVQMHPVTDEPVHFDLFRVDAHQQIRISVPVHFRNHEASPGIKRGGTLNIVSHEVELLCPADQIPEELLFDLTGLDIGDAIRVGQFELPAGVQATGDQEFVVATVAGSSAQAAEEAAEGEAEAGGEPAES